MTGYMCSSPQYEFGGMYFEYHSHLGPVRLKKDGDPYAVQGRTFYAVIDRFNKLTKDQKRKCRVGGGCIKF